MQMETIAAHRWPRRFAIIAGDIKLAHSVFAMPFALMATFMAALGPTRGTWFVSPDGGTVDADPGTRHPYLHPDHAPDFWPWFWGHLALIIAAMVFARTAAMLANRILDRNIDRDNPRTAMRAIPSGQLRTAHAAFALAISGTLFAAVCIGFGVFYGNWWPAILALPVLAWICAYGWFKRFTSLCHIYLGSSLAISPIAAAIAIEPHSIVPWSAIFQPSILLVSLMVLCWVAGFDIIYALQDVDADLRHGLFSIPSRLGVSQAMFISRGLHTLSIACLVACLLVDERLNVLFGLGIGVVASLLLYEHLTVARWGTTRIALAFFTLNGIISCVLGALGIADVLL